MNTRERSEVKDTKFLRRRRPPSFSSSLLDTIYRSIDESKVDQEDLGYFRETNNHKKKQNNNNYNSKLESLFKEEKEITNLGRAIMIESWVERQSIRSSSLLFNSGSSSSESSSGAAWSSSETESSYKQRSKPKQIKKEVSVYAQNYMKFKESGLDKQNKPYRENGISLTKTKLKALKIYGELKKVKQPISPGGRLASFINSIFNSGNAKKTKMCYVGAVDDVSSEQVLKSACSSASKYSRSCLSKSASSRSKQSNGVKRSVKFYPVSVILGEDDSHSGGNYDKDPSLMPLPSIPNFAKRSSVVNKDLNFFMENKNGSFSIKDEDEDEDDDLESYSSSDLFEIDHLVGINGRYREELPMYETTNMKTNQAITNMKTNQVNGFIL